MAASGLANASACRFFMMAADLVPLSLLQTVRSCQPLFTVVLVFNLLFARWLLKEAITWPKMLSSATILIGAVICTLGAPAEVKTVFTPSDISALFEGHIPFVATLATLMSLAIAGIVYVERAYPMTAEVRAARGATPVPPVVPPVEPPPVPAPAPKTAVRLPPPWLDALMAVVYPASLGFDESLADLLIRAWTAMLGACTGGLCDGSGRAATCDSGVVYASIAFWVLLSFGGSLIWMPSVYQRYEVSVALPIE